MSRRAGPPLEARDGGRLTDVITAAPFAEAAIDAFDEGVGVPRLAPGPPLS